MDSLGDEGRVISAAPGENRVLQERSGQGEEEADLSVSLSRRPSETARKMGGGVGMATAKPGRMSVPSGADSRRMGRRRSYTVTANFSPSPSPSPYIRLLFFVRRDHRTRTGQCRCDGGLAVEGQRFQRDRTRWKGQVGEGGRKAPHRCLGRNRGKGMPRSTGQRKGKR